MDARTTSLRPRRRTLLALAVAVLALAGAGRLAIQLSRLVAGSPAVFGAVDLSFRYREVQRWFAGAPVYGALDTAVYPPATYPLLWPFLGWTSWPGARLLWAATGLAALAVLALLLLRGSAAEDRQEKLLVLLLPAAFYATGVTLAAGQMLVHLLPALVGGTLLLARPGASLRRDALAALLLTLGLGKPTAAAPFVMLALLLARRIRPALLVAGGYLALTLLALSFQPMAPGRMLAGWLPTAAGVAASSGYGHLPMWLSSLGLGRWQLEAALAALLLLALWILRHRSADPWVLLGMTALAARVWTYHQYYDDVLALVPMAAAFRLAKHSPSPRARSRAGALFAAAAVAGLAPTAANALPRPWDLAFQVPQMLAWAGLAVALGRAASEGEQPVGRLPQSLCPTGDDQGVAPAVAPEGDAAQGAPEQAPGA